MLRNIPGASPAKVIALVRATARIGDSNGHERIFPAWLRYLTHSCPLCRLDDQCPPCTEAFDPLNFQNIVLPNVRVVPLHLTERYTRRQAGTWPRNHRGIPSFASQAFGIAPLSGRPQQSWDSDRARREVNGQPAPRVRVSRVTSRLLGTVLSNPMLRTTRQKRSYR